jgi:hypothetical protein
MCFKVKIKKGYHSGYFAMTTCMSKWILPGKKMISSLVRRTDLKKNIIARSHQGEPKKVKPRN